MFPPTESPGDGETGRVEPLGIAVLDDPPRDGVALLDRHRIAHFRRAVVFGEDDRGADADRELADEPVVGVRVTEHPARTVDVEDHGQRSRRAAWLDDPDFHRAGRATRDGDPFLVDVGLRDLAGLHLVQERAALGRRQIGQERRVGGRLGERLCGRLEHRRSGGRGRGHVVLLSWLTAAASATATP
jgi:hypothetical protein